MLEAVQTNIKVTEITDKAAKICEDYFELE